MKLFKYGLPLAALAVLASCSSDNLGEPSNSDAQSPTTELGDGTYIDLNFAIPSIETRALSNSFDDGEVDEYRIKDATLYLFDSSADKKCIGSVSLNKYFGITTETTYADITEIHAIDGVDISSLVQPTEGDGTYKTFPDVYALVIINKNGLKNTASDNLPAVGENYATWASRAINYSSSDPADIMRDGVYFTMTSALGWNNETLPNGQSFTDNAQAVNSDPSCLTKIDNSYIYYKGNPLATKKPVKLYVNRCLSKISIAEVDNVDSFIGLGDWYKVKQGADVKDWIKFEGWALEVTNQQSYPVQNYDAADNEWYSNSQIGIDINSDWSNLTGVYARFTTLAGASGPLSNFHRLYWGVDPNMTEINPGNGTYPFGHGNETLPASAFKTDTKFYCLENMMNVQAMKHNQTTTAVFKGYYYADSSEKPSTEGKGTNLLSLNGKYAIWDDVLTLNESNFNDDSKLGPINTAFQDFDDTKVDEYYQKYQGELGSEWTTAGEDEKKAECVEMARRAYNQAKENVLKALDLGPNSTADVYFHKDGEVYYTVLIRHFNDTELGLPGAGATNLGTKMQYNTDTGVLSLTNTDGPDGEAAYPSDKDQYLLGRYSVLRNNWYELCLQGVEAMGLPTTTKPDGRTDDDKSDLVLDVAIHILNWAKRYQDVDLK